MFRTIVSDMLVYMFKSCALFTFVIQEFSSSNTPGVWVYDITMSITESVTDHSRRYVVDVT